MIFSKYKRIVIMLTLMLPLLVSAERAPQQNSSLQTTPHQWTRTNPGGGGAISMVGATKSGILIAASDISGVYRSLDKGKTWQALGANNGLNETHVNALGFHSNDGNTFYMGTSQGLYKTKDAGKTIYQAILETRRLTEGSDKADGYIESIGMAFKDPSIGYLAHYEDWNPELTFMRTKDAGETWKIIKTKGIPNNARVIKLLVDPQKNNFVYALTGKGRFGCGPAQLYRTRNGGKIWKRIGKNIGDILDIDINRKNPRKIVVSTFKVNPCGVDEHDKPIDYVDGEGSFEDYLAGNEYSGDLYSSKNRGRDFKKIFDKTGIISVDHNNPKHITLVDILYPYDWNPDAGTWETNNNGKRWKHTGFVSDWDKDFAGNQYYSFTSSFHGINKTLSKDLFNSDNFYGSFGQYAWASFDGGKQLKNVSTQAFENDQWLSTGVENINGHALDVNDKNPDIIYMGGYDIGFWASKNHGASWTRSQPDYNQYAKYVWDLGPTPIDIFQAHRGAGANVNTLLSDPERENVVWASFSRQQINGETGLFKSTSHGKNWVLSTNGLPGGSSSVRMHGLSLDINSPINSRTLFMTVDGTIYKSVTDGLSWSSVLSSEQSGGLKFTQVDKFNRNLVYAGGEGGLWRSINAGVDWSQVQGIYATEMKGIAATSDATTNTRKDIIPTYNEIDYSGEEPTISVHAWQGVFDIKTDPNVQNRVYVTAYGKNKGLYRSDDAGLTWTKLITDNSMRGIAIAPADSNILYATASLSYHSGGSGNSLGVLYSNDAGITWQDANHGMAWSYAGTVKIETGNQPNVWVWSPGTGVQFSPLPPPNPNPE